MIMNGLSNERRWVGFEPTVMFFAYHKNAIALRT